MGILVAFITDNFSYLSSDGQNDDVYCSSSFVYYLRRIFSNIDEKGHEKHVSDHICFLEAQTKDSKFLCSLTVINDYQNSDVQVFGIRPQ